MAPVDEAAPFWFGEPRPGATPSEVDFAEHHVGFRLPTALRQLLLTQNGGVSNYAAFVSGKECYPMLPMFRVGSKVADGTIMRAFDIGQSFGVPAGVVPFAGQGESWWGLDYRTNREVPAVVFLQDPDHEIEPVASTFDEFLGGLAEDWE